MTGSAALDEMVDGRGGLRPQWRSVLGAFSAIGDGGLAERARRLERAFEEEGVTSVLPGASAEDNAWRCDPVPLPIPAAEFADLEAGLMQRARLLEAVLEDVYGPQETLARGLLPAAVVFANPGFLRPCRDVRSGGDAVPPRAPRLLFYAADLIRGPDAQWRVLADRTAGPAGIGYARENRRLLARVLPEAFRPVQVRQLRPFFDVWQDALRGLAPPGRDNPTVALLTPGTSHPEWFEHMFLSRELSCALVEGGDLTVRGGIVYLKTLRGLQQVDVLVRRLDGRLIDPLELDAGSLMGAPGLLDATRAGNVRIVNDPGTGAVEAPVLAAFLPELCLHLLGERMLTSSVPTMWLGEERARDLVQHDLTRWLIRPALDGTVPAVSPSEMEPAERTALLRRIAARPFEWCASASIPPSVAPCLGPEGLRPRPVVLRVFLTFDGREWRVMQGGLARVIEDSGRLAGSLPRRALSKDVWVMTEDRTDIVGPPAARVPPLSIRRTSGNLPSRVADNLFWLGRYVDRLERAARLYRATVARLARGTALLPREISELETLADCIVEAGFVKREAAASVMTGGLANALLASVRKGGSVQTTISNVEGLIESVRDRLTGDMYGAFTQALRGVRADAAAVGSSLDGLSHDMVVIQRFSTVVAGVAAENMVRGGGWLFLDLGRRIERAKSVAEELARALSQPAPRIESGLRLALELCDSAITYRGRYMTVLQPAPVLDLVLADPGNPRGLAFQLMQMHDHLDELTGGAGPREAFAGATAGLLVEVETMVETVLAATDQNTAAADLPPQLRAIAASVGALSDRITRRYFALLPAVQTLGWTADSRQLQGAA